MAEGGTPSAGAALLLITVRAETPPAVLTAVFAAVVCPRPSATRYLLCRVPHLERSSAFPCVCSLGVFEAHRPDFVGVPQFGWEVQVPILPGIPWR